MRERRRSGYAAGPLAAIVLLWIPSASVAAVCLEYAVPEERRANLENLDGTGYVPFGVWTGTWDSSRLTHMVVKLLAGEVVGYNATISGAGESSDSGLYALAGCRAPLDFATDPQCSSSPTFEHHAALEVWGHARITTMRERLAALPEVMPEDAGDTGYEGVEEEFILQQQQQEAYQAQGLALEYYRSYDAGWWRPQVYFDNYTSYDPATLKPCNQTVLIDSAEMENYVRVTGDQAGVVRNPDGTLSGRCWHDSWWLSPACRANAEQCIPWVTAGNGWLLHDVMQRAAVFNMPMALTTFKHFRLWGSAARATRSMFYWWQPDSTLIDLKPVMLTFPPYDAAARARKVRTSMGVKKRISKWVHGHLRLKSSRLDAFVRRVSISMNAIEAMLLEQKMNGNNDESIACNWVRNNEHVWRRWIPAETECVPGMGLINKDRSFVESRVNATACEWCPPGRSFAPVRDQTGTTHICQKCVPGRSQANPGQPECSACEAGTFADAYESRECRRCPAGFYQNETARSSCEPCVEQTTTGVAGATHAADCGCPKGFYAPRSPASTSPCEVCPEGMDCQFGSKEANIPSVDGAIARGEHPRPLPMFYTSYIEPLAPYRCLDEQSCPGRAPNACSGNSVGIACGACKSGYYRTMNAGCAKCDSMSGSVWPLMVIVFLVHPIICCLLYMKSQDPLSKWGSPMNCTSSAIFVTIIYVQIIAAVWTCYLRYPDVFRGSVEWTAFSLNWLFPIRPGCLEFAGFKLRFITRLMLPVYALLVFVCTWLLSKVAARLNPTYLMNGNIVMSCYGSVYNTFFTGIASQTFSLFQCYKHPNKKFSLRSSPDVLCNSQTWQDLLFTAVAATVVFCGGALALFGYINLNAPSRFHDEVFRKRWRFLFMRFRPNVWWWGMLLLIKGVWLNLATVIFTEGHLQLIWLTFAHVAYLVCCFALLPWRSLGVSALDVFMNASLLLLFSLLAHFAVRSEESEAQMAFVSLACCVAPVLGMCAVVLAQLRAHLRPSDPEWQDRAERLCSAFSQITDVDQLKKCLEALPTADVWTLEAANVITRSELLGQEGGCLKLPRRLANRSSTSLQFAPTSSMQPLSKMPLGSGKLPDAEPCGEPCASESADGSLAGHSAAEPEPLPEAGEDKDDPPELPYRSGEQWATAAGG